jgi:flagellar biosynthesis protein FliQ
MNEAVVMDITRQGMMITLMVSLPILAIALFVGLAVSVFQAVTQIQEMTLTYVPKLVGAVLVILLMGNWMITTLVGFTVACFAHAARVNQ